MSCHDLPAAFEVLKDRKVLMDKSRKLLGFELEEKNVYVSIKADHLSETIKEVGHYGASQNDGSLILQNDQSMLQGGDDQRTSRQVWDHEQTKDMNTYIYHVHSLNVDDHDLMVARGTEITCQTKQNSDVQDHDHNGVSSVGKGVSYNANNADEQNEDLPDIELPKNALGAKDEDIKEISYEDTTRNNYNAESQHIGYIDYTSILDCENMRLKDLDGVSYKGPSVHAHERDRDLESISHAIVNHNCCHSSNISTEMSHAKMNTVIGDQEKTENIMMMTSNSSTLLPKSSGEQMYAKNVLGVNDQVSNGEEDRRQLAGPLQPHYHPSEGTMCNGSDDLQIRQQHVTSGQQSSSIYSDNGVLSQQQVQLTTSVFPVGNRAAVGEPFSNPQSNGQLQTAMNIGAVSDPIQHAKSIKQLIDETLPIGSSTDGTLLNAVSQYKQPSSPTGHDARNQVCPPQNLLPRAQGKSSSVPDMNGNTHNMASN